MKLLPRLNIFILLLFASLCSCTPKTEQVKGETRNISPTPKPSPRIAYLNEGNLWMIQIDGTNRRELAVSPEGQTIQDFVWAPDGSRIYFAIGLQLFEVVVATGNVANAGELIVPAGITVDRLEMARDGRTIIVNALDADVASRNFAVAIGSRESRELSIDEYTAIIPLRPSVLRSVGEMSVSPDGRQVLFKDSVGAGEELFVSDIETGARTRITNLYELSGFEDSVETEGGRRVIEAAWSPDGRYVIFNPMQSCSETGLCYGRLFLVQASGGAQLQLSVDMMINLPVEWTPDANSLAYDDGSRLVIASTAGNPKALGEGNRPKWQPAL